MSVLRMALVMAGVVAAAGCSAAANPPDTHLPLDAYSLGAEDRAQVLRARFALAEECMRRAGIDFRFPAVEPVTDLHNIDYLGWFDPGEAQKLGYVGERRNVSEDTGIPTYSGSDDEFRVLEGKVRRYHGRTVPPGGCMAEADAILNRGARGVTQADVRKKFDDDEVPRYAGSASDAASKDPRIAAAERAWSECMESRGFHYSDTGQAGGDPRWATTAKDDQIVKPRGTRAEIDTAVADAQCRVETGYSDVRRTVYVEAQQRVIDRDRARLDVIRSLNEARLANSVKVLGSQRR